MLDQIKIENSFGFPEMADSFESFFVRSFVGAKRRAREDRGRALGSPQETKSLGKTNQKILIYKQEKRSTPEVGNSNVPES